MTLETSPLAPASCVTIPGFVGWTAPSLRQCRTIQIAASWSSWPVEHAESGPSVLSNAHISKPIRRSRGREAFQNLSPTDDDDGLPQYEGEWEVMDSNMQHDSLPSLERPQRVGLKKAKKIGQPSQKAVPKRANSASVQQHDEPAMLAWADTDFERSKLHPRMAATSVKRGTAFLGKRLSTKEWEKQVYHMVKQQKYQDATTSKQSTQTRSPLALRTITGPTVAIPPRKPDSLRVPKSDSDTTKHEDDARFEYLRKQLGLERNWRPLVEYLFTLGLKNEDFQKICQRHKACLQINVDAVKGRVGFLKSLGIEAEVLKKLVVRHPQVIEYRVESTKPRLDYLKSLGIPESGLGKVIASAPAILEYNLRSSLQPRVKFLREVVGIRAADLPKVVTRSPQVLTQSIEEALEPQVEFFLQEMKITEAALAKIITRHPQVLHYSVEDGIRPRITFLKSIGMSEQDIVKVLTRMTQVFSLSVENSLKPKYEYLVKELKGGVRTVVSFPAYFSLSLDHRIKPRHQFLITLQKSPKGPFPMKCLAVTDEYFCSRWAEASLEDYYAFRDALLLKSFAEKFEKKNTVQL